MAELDDLSNEQLRAKLVEHGLGNVPVTNTTRKVLINKLKKSLNGELPVESQKASARRETIHVVKAKVEEEKEETNDRKKRAGSSTNRRITIAAPASVSVQAPEPVPAAQPKSTTRRSGRITPSAPLEKTVLPSVPNTVTEEASDDDEVIFVPPVRSSKSRSPSLSKSETVTTSFKQIQSKRNVNEILEESEYSDDAEIPTYVSSTTYIPTDNHMQHKIVLPPKLTPEKPSENPYWSSANLTNRRTTAGFSKTIDRPPLTTSYTDYNPKEDADIRRHRLTISSFGGRTEYRSKLHDEVESDQTTPYLSDFARRLSHLKADRIDLGVRKELLLNDEGSIHHRRTVREKRYSDSSEETVWGSFKVLIGSFDRKYRKILLLTFAIALGVFVYVMFFTNN